MLALRPSQERGHANHGWLDTHYTFSFSNYFDPKHMGFRTLRVINEDTIAGGAGFPTHSHNDMEIITVVLKGSLQHKDSMGNTSVILPGDVQYMSAGTGVRHSEFNPDHSQETHLMQIWMLPDREGHTPRYGQKSFKEELEKKNLVLAASRDGRDGSIEIHQDADLFLGRLAAGGTLEVPLEKDRHAWVQVIGGEFEVSGKKVATGDGLAVSNETLLKISAQTAGDFLLFDLP